MSAERSIETGHQPTLTVQSVGGNLSVSTWGEARILARTSDDSLTLESDAEGGATLSAPADTRVYLPQHASLIVEDAHGDTQIFGVQGEITVQKCRGNLSLAQTGPATLDNVAGNASIREIAGPLTVEKVSGNCSASRIQGPMQIQRCAGNLTVKDVQGSLEINSVAGSASVKGIQGPLTLTSVSGDLMANSIAGPATVDTVQGGASLTQILGPLQVDNCSGDLAVRGVTGSVTAQVGGSASLRLQLPAGGHCQVSAGGSIHCRVPMEVNAQVRLASGANDIHVKHLGVNVDRRQGSAEFSLGSGEGVIDLEAGEAVLLLGRLEDTPEFQFGPFNVEMDAEMQREMVERTSEWIQQFTDQVESQMETLSAQLDERLTQLGTSDEIASRVQAKVQQAMRKAEEKIAAAMRQAEQRARAAERQAERRERRQRRGYGSGYATPPTPPSPPPMPTPPRAQRARSAPVSDEERMVILRMVEEGKISVEQAEKLLAALESST